MPARVHDRAGSAALRHKGARGQKPESREPGSENTSGLGVQAAPREPDHWAPPRPPPLPSPASFIPSLTGPVGPVSVAGSATGGLLGVRGNAFRLEQLPVRLRPHWLFARAGGGCRTEAAADWLAVPAPAERYWVSGRRPDDPPEDRELPVRVVSGGLGAGGDCDLTAARMLPAPSRVSVSLCLRFLPSAQCPGRSSLLPPDDPQDPSPLALDSPANCYSFFKTHSLVLSC